MSFIGSARPMNRVEEKGDMLACSAHTREVNLRSILVRTVSWRRFKKPETDSCESADPLAITPKTKNAKTKELVLGLDLSSSHRAIPPLPNDSKHSFSSEDSFADDEDSKRFEWSADDLSIEDDEQHAKQSSNETDDSKYNSSHQSLETSGPRSIRHLERQASRRRRKHNNFNLNSALDLGASFESLDSASSYDETLDTTLSDSQDLGSSRHSVGRCGRRRSTHSRLLHQPHRQRQRSVSTSSDPLPEYSNKSVLQKRVDNILQAQSQHSVSSREAPRYIVVKSDDLSQHDHKSRRSVRTTRSDDPKGAAQTHPRFIVVQSGPKDDSDKYETRRTRRGRRRTISEKSHSV